MRDVELWEAVALSLNFDPDKLPVYLGAYDRFGDDPFRICPPSFLERMQVANSNAGVSFPLKVVNGLKARCLVDLPGFGLWASSVWANLPHELPKASPSEREYIVGWLEGNYQASMWWGLSSVSSEEAARLLSGTNPHDPQADPSRTTHDGRIGPAEYADLRRVLEDVATDGAKRSLREWFAVVQGRRLRYHPWIDEWLAAGGDSAAKAREGSNEKLGHSVDTTVDTTSPADGKVSVQVSGRSGTAGGATDTLPLKRSALVQLHKATWPTVDRDLSDASANGLAAAAKKGSRGWDEALALAWARARGKLEGPRPAGVLQSAMPGFTSRVHKIEN